MSQHDGLRKFRVARAKALRARTTEPEQVLWRALKRVPTLGTHFRRQVPIGPYVADFACLRVKLVIELDGGHHSEEATVARDTRRTAWLEQEGYRVLRFWNAELSDNLEGVLDTIYAALHGGLAAEMKPVATPPHPAAADAAATLPLKGRISNPL
ncbi:endonuclease domain-containing protein [Chelatococcus sp. GCM10030263]|uniref:endonuclease domain-containing protein n=1 Tax=Chelatococcus sp. GCM10030263 TaxID=3273387 RepID=UPI003613A43A